MEDPLLGPPLEHVGSLQRRMRPGHSASRTRGHHSIPVPRLDPSEVHDHRGDESDHGRQSASCGILRALIRAVRRSLGRGPFSRPAEVLELGPPRNPAGRACAAAWGAGTISRTTSINSTARCPGGAARSGWRGRNTALSTGTGGRNFGPGSTEFDDLGLVAGRTFRCLRATRGRRSDRFEHAVNRRPSLRLNAAPGIRSVRRRHDRIGDGGYSWNSCGGAEARPMTKGGAIVELPSRPYHCAAGLDGRAALSRFGQTRITSRGFSLSRSNGLPTRVDSRSHHV